MALTAKQIERKLKHVAPLMRKAKSLEV